MKKSSILILAVALAVIVAGFGYSYGLAAGGRTFVPAKVGIVRLDMILKTSTRHSQWQDGMSAEQKKIRAELDKLDSEAELTKKDMATREPGSSDYMTLMASLLEKQATVDAKQKYYEADMREKVRKWTEQLYMDIRVITARLAKEKGLDVVLAAQEVEFPSPSVVDLANTMRTNKVLYHSENLDITAEVLAELDSTK
jgi:Skp family chaperone for outer membrane proteins